MIKRILSALLIIIMLTGMFFSVPVSAGTPMLSHELINLYPSQSFRLTVTDTYHNYTFSVEDENIAAIDNKGIVYAKSVGVTEIYCTFLTGEVLNCTVNVKQGASPEGVELSKNNITLFAGEQAELESAVIPVGADDYIFYQSSDEDIAQIEQNGVITALKPGVTVITVETASSAVNATCLVRVLPDSGYSDFGSDISGVLYDISGEPMTNTSVGLKGRFSEQKAATDTRGRFHFRSIGSGNYVLTVYNGATEEESVSAEIDVNASDIKISCIYTNSGLAVLYGASGSSGTALRDIELLQNRVQLNIGDIYDIAYTAVPADAAETYIMYNSSDTDVVDVDKSGRVTAMKEGIATVYVSSSNGKVTKKLIVMVSQGDIGKFEWAIIYLQLFIILMVVAFYLKSRDKKKGEVI